MAEKRTSSSKHYLADAAPFAAFACCIAGCLATEEPAPLPPAEALRVLAVEVYDWAGTRSAIDAIPRRPLVALEVSETVDSAAEPAMLLSGPADAQLLEDLEKRPLRASNARRVVPCATSYEAQIVTLRPETPLEALATYTVALAGWASSVDGQRLEADGAPFVFQLEVSASIHAGASAVEAWPADGTAGVAPNLLFAAIRFDGQVGGEQEGIWLEDADGLATPALIHRSACDEIGWTDGVCVMIEPQSPLAPGAQYKIAVGDALRDSRGAPVVPWSASFRTAAQPDHRPPGLLPLPCALDEREVATGCGLVDDARIELSLQADEPARFQLSTTEGQTSLVAPRGQGRAALVGLQPDALVALELLAVDAAGNRSFRALSVRTEAAMARLSITEVRADPQGPEPQQEFVELTNYGDQPVDLKGFALSDSLDSLGDVLGRSVTAHPGAPLLLVPDRFDPEEPKDDAPPPGTQLVHIGTSLGDSGLSNSGEAIFLRDSRGRRVSAAPAMPPPRPGICLVRVANDMRDGSPDAFAYDPEGRCTPGR